MDSQSLLRWYGEGPPPLPAPQISAAEMVQFIHGRIQLVRLTGRDQGVRTAELLDVALFREGDRLTMVRRRQGAPLSYVDGEQYYSPVDDQWSLRDVETKMRMLLNEHIEAHQVEILGSRHWRFNPVRLAAEYMLLPGNRARAMDVSADWARATGRVLGRTAEVFAQYSTFPIWLLRWLVAHEEIIMLAHAVTGNGLIAKVAPALAHLGYSPASEGSLLQKAAEHLIAECGQTGGRLLLAAPASVIDCMIYSDGTVTVAAQRLLQIIARARGSAGASDFLKSTSTEVLCNLLALVAAWGGDEELANKSLVRIFNLLAGKLAEGHAEKSAARELRLITNVVRRQGPLPLPHNASYQTLLLRATARVGAWKPAVPALSIAGMSFKPLTSSALLFAEGLAQQNCLATSDHAEWVQCLAENQSQVVLAVVEEGVAAMRHTLEIRRDQGRWVIGQLKRSNNNDPVQRALSAALLYLQKINEPAEGSSN